MTYGDFIMSKYKILLFDADATLLDFHRSEYEAVIDCLEYAGLPATDEIIKKYSEINDGYWKMLERNEITKPELMVARWRSLLEYYNFDFDAEIISNLYPEKLSEKCYILDGAEELCKKLHGKFKMYIITNGFKSVQQKRFCMSPLAKYFDDVFISEDIGYDKPSIKYFELISKRIPDFDPAKALVIGDSLTSDIRGGINAGIDTCWYNPKGKKAPDDMKITYTISNLSQIEGIVL